MVSNWAAVVFLVIIIFTVRFMTLSLRDLPAMKLIHKLYFACCCALAFWSVAMLGLKFTHPADLTMLYVWDALTYPGVTLISPLMLMIAMTISAGAERMPRKWLLLFVVPAIGNVIVWTNPLHHLHYKTFSTVRDELVPGPTLYLGGFYVYFCIFIGIVLMIRYALRNRSRLFIGQSLMYILGSLFPLTISMVATLGFHPLPITATPLSFIATLICHYIAIYRLHIMDIRPHATRHVLDWISDGYLIISPDGIVVSFNRPFRETFGELYGISEGLSIQKLSAQKSESGGFLYNLITAVGSCRETQSRLSYEQAINTPDPRGDFTKKYYIIDVSPLIINRNLSGFIIILKDFTQVKRSMQQLHDSQSRMMEQERLAFLGQMMGGLAHNLKTPIMSISGCVSAVETLMDESNDSLSDPDVTPEDYREINTEIQDWLQKIRESCSYMSDIITAVKGQAAHATISLESQFTAEELIKRTVLLMRHELQNGGCQLILEDSPDYQYALSGDINGLIQVLNNLITNAIDSMQRTGGGKIYLGARMDEKELSIYIKDTGAGIAPQVRKRLFKEMTTSKGAKGTGLGLYISNALVRGKFGGRMWADDNPDGGAIFGLSIPIENVRISNNLLQEGIPNEKNEA